MPDDDEGDVLAVAAALGYRVAGIVAVARHATTRCAWSPAPGLEGDGDWVVAVLSPLPVRSGEVVPVGPQLRRDPGRRAVVRAVVDAGGALPSRWSAPTCRCSRTRCGGSPRPSAPLRTQRAGSVRRRHEHVGLVRRPHRRARVAACGAGPHLPGPPAPQPDRPHHGQPGRGGRLVRGGAAGHVRPPTRAGPPAVLRAACRTASFLTGRVALVTGANHGIGAAIEAPLASAPTWR